MLERAAHKHVRFLRLPEGQQDPPSNSSGQRLPWKLHSYESETTTVPLLSQAQWDRASKEKELAQATRRTRSKTARRSWNGNRPKARAKERASR